MGKALTNAGKCCLTAVATALAVLLASCVTTSSYGQISEAPSASYHGAFDTAVTYGNAPEAGVILHLHGCNGLDISQGWQREWVRLLTARGFLVIAPDSFADPRPPISCPKPGRVGKVATDTSKIYEIRKKQTAYSLRRIREAYPNAKILVWGQSEGAGVANRIDEKVDGIITTGAPCWRVTKIRTDVPFMVIQGTDDRFIEVWQWHSQSYYGSLEERCKRAKKSSLWRYVIVPGMGHSAPLRFVESEVSEFLDFALDNAANAPMYLAADDTGSSGVPYDARLEPTGAEEIDTKFGKKFIVKGNIRNVGTETFKATWFTGYLCSNTSSSINIVHKNIDRELAPGDVTRFEFPFSLTKLIWDEANEDYFSSLHICNSRIEFVSDGKWGSFRFDDWGNRP